MPDYISLFVIPPFVASVSCFSFFAMTEGKAQVDIDTLREQGYSVKMISPIFSQLVMLSFPKGFKTVFENTNHTAE